MQSAIALSDGSVKGGSEAERKMRETQIENLAREIMKGGQLDWQHLHSMLERLKMESGVDPSSAMYEDGAANGQHEDEDGHTHLPYLSSPEHQDNTPSLVLSSSSSKDTISSRKSSSEHLRNNREQEQSPLPLSDSRPGLSPAGSEGSILYQRNNVAEYQILFSDNEIHAPEFSEQEIVDELVEQFPELCEAPATMFSEDGEPLPLTKREESTQAERDARKAAILLNARGTMDHSLLKVSVVLEKRIALWRRVADLPANANYDPSRLSLLDAAILDPWRIELAHSDLDPEKLTGKKLKKTLELASSRRPGVCPSCKGAKCEPCNKCHGKEPDACWWCKGSGKASGGKCRTCTGSGKLICKGCNDTRKKDCAPCKGQGVGLFSAFVQVTVSKVDFAPVSLSTVLSAEQRQEARSDWEVLRQISIDYARDMISETLAHDVPAFDTTRPPSVAGSVRTQHTSRTSVGGKKKTTGNHHFRPLLGLCSVHNSVSHIVELEVPQQAKVVKKKKSLPTLKGKGFFQRKVLTRSYYFAVPTDRDLLPAEMTMEEVKRTMATIEHAAKRRRAEKQPEYHRAQTPEPGLSHHLQEPVYDEELMEELHSNYGHGYFNLPTSSSQPQYLPSGVMTPIDATLPGPSNVVEEINDRFNMSPSSSFPSQDSFGKYSFGSSPNISRRETEAEV